MRYLPLAGMVLFVAVAVGWRSWLQRRRYGSSGIMFFRSRRPSQMARDGLSVVWFALLLGQAIAAAAWPDWLADRSLVTGGGVGVLHAAGAALLIGGLLLLVRAQLELGASWRIGIEHGASPGLVTGGLYRLSRNPIFFAFLAFVTGYALLIPTALSAVLFVGSYVGIRQQIAVEEKYLDRTYGAAYRDYARRVGRLVPGIGRRRDAAAQ
jgi:protein-S-isoprenylcysteine O-methyltransferase Ste14